MSRPPISQRLAREIATYCHELNAITLDDLAADIADGPLAWFPDEFAAAIESGNITPSQWGQLTDTDLDGDDTRTLEADLRLVWSKIAPGQPFPLDA